MDNYLDTLVKKADQPSEEVSENKEEPTAVVAEVPAEEVKEEAPKAEEPVKEDQDTEEKKEEDPEDEETAELEIKEAEDEKDAVEEEYTFMADIRVYNIPDIKSPSKVISTNIKKIKEVAGMIQIEYLKQGFGMVRGYIRK